jgi:hypothetical protein
MSLDDVRGKEVQLYFAHIQHPYARFLKGITQILYSRNKRAALHGPEGIFALKTYHDPHVMAISDWIPKDILKDTHFIPMDAPNGCNSATNKFFDDMWMNLSIQTIKHQSTNAQKNALEEVKKSYGLHIDPKGNQLYRDIIQVYATDLALHQEALVRENPEPSTFRRRVLEFFGKFVS